MPPARIGITIRIVAESAKTVEKITGAAAILEEQCENQPWNAELTEAARKLREAVEELTVITEPTRRRAGDPI